MTEILVCRRCGKPIVEVAPGRFGHVTNPGPAHHYATPKRAGS